MNIFVDSGRAHINCLLSTVCLNQPNGYRSQTITIILIDKIGNGSRIEEMAKNIGGHIIQMSGTYWVHKLSATIKEAFPFYDNPLLHISKEQSLDYLKERVKTIDLSAFYLHLIVRIQISLI